MANIPFAYAAVDETDFVPTDSVSSSTDGTTMYSPSNTFILDAEDNGGDVTLQFGTTLSEYIQWNDTGTNFDFSDETLVLDASNTGAGANVDIIANQGSDNDGTLRYNATTNQWEISNDGGAFTAIGSGGSGLWEDGTNGVYEDDEGVIVGIDQAETLANAGFTLATGDLFVQDQLGVEGNVYTDGDAFISGEVLASDGAASAPSFSFTNDTTTGIYRPSASNIGFATGGGLRLRIDGTVTRVLGGLDAQSSVTLGDAAADVLTSIGTWAGASPFVLEGATADDYETTFAVTDPTADRTITFQDGSGTVAFTSDISAAGNTLDAAYDQGGAGAGRTINVDSGAVRLTGTDDTDEALVATNSGAGGAVFIETTGSGHALWINDESSDLSPFVVDNDGDVGIGTSTPDYKLTVEDGAVGSATAQIGTQGAYSIVSGTQTGSAYGINGVVAVTGSASSTGTTTDSMAGMNGTYYHGSTGTVTQGSGVLGVFYTADATPIGTVTDAIGTLGTVVHTTTGTITNASGLYGADSFNIGGGAITNNYGLYVDDQTAGTNDYGIYVKGADTYAILVDADDVVFDANTIIGGSTSRTETITDAGFSLGGDDLFVAGTAGIEGNVYTDSSLIAGTTTYGDGSVAGSAALGIASGGSGALTLDSDSGILTLGAGTNTITNTDASTALLLNPTGQVQFFGSSNNIDSSGNMGLAGSMNSGGLQVTGLASLNGNTTLGDTAADILTSTGTWAGASPFVLEGATADDYETTFAVTDPTADRTITFQDGSGTVAFLSDVGGGGLWETGTNGTYEDDAAVIIGIDQAETLANAGFTLAAGDLFVQDELGVEGDIFTDGAFFIDNNVNETALTVTSSATSSNPVSIEANSLTTGSALNIESILTGSANTINETNIRTTINSGTQSGEVIVGNYEVEYTGSSVDSNGAFGTSSRAKFNSTGTGNILVGSAGYAQVEAVANGTISYMAGTEGSFEHDGTGTVSNAYSLLGLSSYSDAGTTTNSYGLGLMFDDTSGGSHTITNQYGIAIPGVDLGSTLNVGLDIGEVSGATDNYAIRTDSGDIVFNESGSDSDFRVEGDAEENLLFVDASEDRVGIGTNTPEHTLDVEAGSAGSGTARVAADLGYLITSGTQSNAVYAGQAVTVLDGSASTSGTLGSSPAGMAGIFSQNSTGTVSQASGLLGVFYTQGATPIGTVGQGAGNTGLVYHTTTGTIEEATAFYAVNAQNVGGGTITDAYGLYVADQTAGTNDYGVYIEGADTYALWVDADDARFDDGVILGDAAADVLTANGTWAGASPFVLEGATANDFETTFAVTDPTADRTITFQDGSGTVAFTSDISGTGLWEDGTNGVYEDDAATIVGPDVAETLSNAGFVLAGNNDLFVGDKLGVEGNVYSDGSFIVGATTTYGDGSITGSGALSISSGGSGDLTLDSDSGNLALGTGTDTITSTAGLTIDPEDNLTFGVGGVADYTTFTGNTNQANMAKTNFDHNLYTGTSDNQYGLRLRTDVITALDAGIHKGGMLIDLDGNAADNATSEVDAIKIIQTTETGGIGTGLRVNATTFDYGIYVADANTYSIWADGADVRFDEDLVVGGSTSSSETIDNGSFSLGGDDLFVAGTAGVEGDVFTDGSFTAGTTTYSDAAINETSADLTVQTTTSGNLILQPADRIRFIPSGDTDDYIYASTFGNTTAFHWEGVLTYTNDPGIKINASTGEMEYRDEDESSWTSLDSLASGGSGLWEDGTNGVYEDDEGVIVGIDQAETLANSGFTLAAGDLFVQDQLGVEGNVYTDGSFIAGASLTLSDTGITDSNSDMNFSSTTDGFNFTLGGGAGDDFIVDTDTFVIESDNNRVGIGTTTPSEKFQVTNGNALIQPVRADGYIASLMVRSTDSGAEEAAMEVQSTPSGGEMRFFRDNSSVVLLSGVDDSYFNSDGKKLGIGTNSAGGKLEVEVDNSENMIGLLVDNNNTTNDTAGLQISMSEGGGAPLLISPLSTAPNTTSEGSIYYDSDTDKLFVYANGGWADLIGLSTEKSLIEGMRGLHQADGSNNNCDSETTYDYTDLEQYNKITGISDDQDIDVAYQTLLPSDFSSWDTNAITITYKTSSATSTTSGVSCSVYDTAGALAHSTSAAASTSKATIAITSANLTDGGETWTPDNDFAVVCKGAVDTAAWTEIGDVLMSYDL